MSARRRTRLAVGVLVALVGAAPQSVAAQAVGGGGLLQSYRFDDANAAGLSEYTLLSTPFAVSLPIGGRVSIQAAGAFADARALGPDGSEATLSGLTDTEVGIALALGPDRVVLTAGAALPTGQSTHSLTEAAVAGVGGGRASPLRGDQLGKRRRSRGRRSRRFPVWRMGYRILRRVQGIERI